MLRCSLALVALGGTLFACSGAPERNTDDDPGAGSPGSGGSSASAGQGAGGTAAGATAGTSASAGQGAGGTPPLPSEITKEQLLPARIRRLTNAEYDATVRALTETQESPGKDFAPDARQGGYTVNDAQRVDSVIARQLFEAATKIAAEVKTQRLSRVAPCANPTGGGAEQCATAFIADFGKRAYRRPLTAEESAALLAVYREGALDATYGDGVEQVVRAVLQSAGLLYLTELGSGAPGPNGTVALNQHEIASSLAYLVTGNPPNTELLNAADSGALGTAEARAAQVERLRSLTVDGRNAAQERLKGVVREWFGTDRLEFTDKDANVYPRYDQLQAAIEKENRDFIDMVLSGTRAVSELLASEYSMVDADLATFYGASGAGRVKVPRRGILNQAAFLATYGHAHESAPVLRGVAVARRVACMVVNPPSESAVVVVVPPPDPTLTTRERFAQHSDQGTSCFACHRLIDPIGFSFEHFDGMGGLREQDNGKPVDASTTIAFGMDFDGTYANSNELAVKLAASEVVRECMARQMFRSLAGQSTPSGSPSESAFVEIWNRTSLNKEDISVPLLEYVKSPLFELRRAQ